MPLRSIVRQRGIVPLVLQSGVRSVLQEEVRNGNVPPKGGQVDWSPLHHGRVVAKPLLLITSVSGFFFFLPFTSMVQ